MSKVLLFAIALFVGLMGGARPVAAQILRAQPGPARRVALDVALLRQQLAPAPGASVRARQATAYRVSLPTLGGERTFVLTESFVLPATDAAAQRRLRTFVGYETGRPAHRISIVLTPKGLTADFAGGTEAASLRPAPDGQAYLLQPTAPDAGPCGVVDAASGLRRPGSFSTQPAPFSFGTQLRRIRYAILVTQEFYTDNGGTDPLVEQAVVTAMNQMSALYSQELSVSFELALPSSGSYYFSAMTTPTLASSDAAAAGRLRNQNLGEVAGFIGGRFASSSYDLGHCFHNSGGGVAYVGIICNSNLTYRAGAWSGVRPTGFRQVLAHEMGHQHGASHTFTGPCGSGSLGSNLEPGGGATIMGYTYVCGAQTLQGVGPTDEDHFNTLSLSQMRDELLSVSCPTVTANANRPPTLSAGADYVIPRNTPFTLTASGADPDGEALVYTWNQFDYTTNLNALGSIVGTGGLAAVDDPEAPLFRPRPPRTTPSRTFPDLQYVLANSNRPADILGEALPNVGRDLHFVVTARDQRASGGTFTTDNVTLTVAPGTGPFAVTTQNTAALWIAGQQATVTWSVNGTNAAPINVGQVRITLSTDGGQTFPTVLAAATSNDGTEAVSIPAVTTTQARLRVEAVGNIFFDVNDVDFPIGPCAPVASQLLPATAVSAPVGDAALNLTQNAFSLTELAGVNQLTGTIAATDPTTFLSNNVSTCFRYSNVQYYDSYVFVPSTTGTYTIGTPVGFNNMVIRVYDSNGFVPSDPCQNVLANNFIPSTFLSRNLTVALTAGQRYTLVLSDFGSTTPSAPVPGAYSVTFTSSPAGGKVFAPLASLGYEYQYAVVNTATNAVVQVAPAADLRSLPAGTYDVYGLLLQGGYNVSSLQNGLLSSLQTALGNLAPCGQLSTNTRRVTITGNPLPVVLTSFTGRAAGPVNALEWTTASEEKVAYFEVQRSLDGTTFAALGRVPATNTSTAHRYTLSDTAPPAGLAYYRLLVQDQDGPASYSPTVSVQRDAAPQPALSLQAFPNPVPTGTTLQLQLQSPRAQTVQLSATDLVGRTVWQQTVTLPAGTTLLPVPGTSRWQGLYVFKLQPTTGAPLQQKVSF
ncbi:zinc-dependent metalloprotease [Hymenobacter sp. 5317J-9]|uniref:M12 family metallo-peptidase n=1 Tax=Hymenobacter sp. 5317J-9 TaxID=2932250 RepID=UPI001FD70BE4|nr:M12 family metallo-peptidase [Hymenobacter sp. 5317J-9]UOQ97696.1 zinc-dependent metalloprotease [Hymenobacter sp. 5317J-9]